MPDGGNCNFCLLYVYPYASGKRAVFYPGADSSNFSPVTVTGGYQSRDLEPTPIHSTR